MRGLTLDQVMDLLDLLLGLNIRNLHQEYVKIMILD
jgi:hypothetical protein